MTQDEQTPSLRATYARIQMDAAMDRLITGAFGVVYGGVTKEDLARRRAELDEAYRRFLDVVDFLTNDARTESVIDYLTDKGPEYP